MTCSTVRGGTTGRSLKTTSSNTRPSSDSRPKKSKPLPDSSEMRSCPISERERGGGGGVAIFLEGTTEVKAIETWEIVDGSDECADRDYAAVEGQLCEGLLKS